MCRQLSQILILLLLVLSPVSYSSAEIPDFGTETPPTATYRLQAAAAAIDGSERKESPLPGQPRSKTVYAVSHATAIPAERPSNPCSGRAPPQ